MKSFDLQHFMPPAGTRIVRELTHAERKKIGLNRMACYVAELFHPGESVRVKSNRTTYRIKCVGYAAYVVTIHSKARTHEFNAPAFIEFLFREFDFCTMLRIEKLLKKERLAEHAMKTKLFKEAEAGRKTAAYLTALTLLTYDTAYII
jgi:hypothetical protein